ncbi:MAG: T9SS type A sorting domain-containing protein, partial [Bacteroidales bacterium]|nr:T9SS type A sorting domain-containing protein [Bacteroidales bacterium]
DSIQLNAIPNFSNGNYTYSWSPTNGVSNPNISNPKVAPNNNVNYIVTLNSNNSCNNPIDSVTINVNQLTVDAGNNQSINCGDSIQLNAIPNFSNGNYTYSWSPTNGVSNPNISNPKVAPNNNVNYIVTLNSNNSCNNPIDSVTINVNPLTVDAGYNQSINCGDSIQLNAIPNFSNGNYTYSWSPTNGVSNPNISNPYANAMSDTQYTVTLFSNNGCNNPQATIDLTILPLDAPEICMVSINNNKNIVIWDKSTSAVIDSFFIWRETNISDIYEKIGSTSYVDSSLFVDISSNPVIHSNKYKISVIDECNLESDKSGTAHKTMHLSINQGMGTTWNLVWEPYEGFTVSSYNIFRGTSPDSLFLIGSVSASSTQYSDYAAPSGNIFYQVQIINPNPCNPTKSFEMSFSNIATNDINFGVQSINDLKQVKVYPNPVSNELVIEIEGNNGKVNFDILNAIGQVVFKGNLVEKTTVQTSNFAPGVYLIKLENGKTFEFRKIIKE